MPVPAPRLQHVESRIVEGLRRGGSLYVRGPSGSGRTVLLEQLRRNPEILVVELLPLEEVDCAAVALVEARASLPEGQRPSWEGERFDYRVAGKELAQAARDQGRFLVIRLPASWERCTRRTGRGEAASDRPGEAHEGDHLKNAARWLSGLLGAGLPVAVVGDAPLEAWLFEFYPQTEDIVLPPHRIELEELAGLGWGTYRSAFDALQRCLRPGQQATPIGWRLAVGLVALGEPAAEAQRLLEHAAPTAPLVRRLGHRLDALPELRRAVGGLVCARRPLSRAEIMTAFDPPLEHRPLLDQCLAYGEEEQRRMAPAVRGLLLDDVAPAPEDAPGWHDRLTAVHRALDGASSPGALGFQEARAWCEKVHHAAHGTDSEEWEAQELAGPEQYWERGRVLSRRGEYERAAEVYLNCTLAFPADDYGWHYLGYNLQQARGEAPAVEAAYRQAIALDPSNSWWNSRLLTFLIGTRQLASARRAWREAVARVDPDGERLRADPWLAEHFHQWIAQSWNEAGRPGFAAEVLEGIPTRILERSPRLQSLQEKIRRQQDSEPRTTPEQTAEIQRWLGTLQALAHERNHREALKQMLVRGEQWLEEGNTLACELLLNLAEVDRLGVELSLGLLAALLPMKEQGNKAYGAFVERIKEKLRKDRPAEVEALLRGFE